MLMLIHAYRVSPSIEVKPATTARFDDVAAMLGPMSESDVPRSVLPIPQRPQMGLVTYDAKDPDSAFPPIEPLRPPAGAPNVLVVLIDDAGFGSRARSVDRATLRRSSDLPVGV